MKDIIIIKINRNNNNESIMVQKFLFEKGYCWGDEMHSKKQTLKTYFYNNHIVLEDNLVYTVSFNNDLKRILTENKEINFKYFDSVLEYIRYNKLKKLNINH